MVQLLMLTLPKSPRRSESFPVPYTARRLCPCLVKVLVAVVVVALAACSDRTIIVCVHGFHHNGGLLSSSQFHQSSRKKQTTTAWRTQTTTATTVTTSSHLKSAVDNVERNNVKVDVEAAEKLKAELMTLSTLTDRGFKASKDQQRQARTIIDQLATRNPTAEPASPYYDTTTKSNTSNTANTVVGKWTLVYTDAPDITSLANASPTAQLGRIGQDCTTPPYIKNVIEWKRPAWAANLPFSGTDDSRILQKVCTKASASPSDPLQLNLDLAGIELVAPPDSDSNGGTSTATGSSLSSFLDKIQSKGLPVGLLEQNPITLEGPLTTPFGKARILYLDDELRILKTYQNYVAVNIRSNPEWF
jgi:hypothetical protein